MAKTSNIAGATAAEEPKRRGKKKPTATASIMRDKSHHVDAATTARINGGMSSNTRTFIRNKVEEEAHRGCNKSDPFFKGRVYAHIKHGVIDTKMASEGAFF